jgi:hypothetical protein
VGSRPGGTVVKVTMWLALCHLCGWRSQAQEPDLADGVLNQHLAMHRLIQVEMTATRSPSGAFGASLLTEEADDDVSSS